MACGEGMEWFVCFRFWFLFVMGLTECQCSEYCCCLAARRSWLWLLARAVECSFSVEFACCQLLWFPATVYAPQVNCLCKITPRCVGMGFVPHNWLQSRVFLCFLPYDCWDKLPQPWLRIRIDGLYWPFQKYTPSHFCYCLIIGSQVCRGDPGINGQKAGTPKEYQMNKA